MKTLRGVRDVFPPEIRVWHKIENTARAIFEGYGFEEIRTPIIEHSELFNRSIGEYTDIVSKEMYTFPDRKGRMISLRPEGTASVIRAYIEHGLMPPTRLYYMGPMFRYERPQAGRQRQFYQMGVEAIGERDSLADAEIIIMLNDLFKKLGLKKVKTVINSVGCGECRPVYEKELKAYFSEHISKMCSDCRQRYEHNVFRIMDCKNAQCRVFIKEAPLQTDFLCESCSAHYAQLKTYLTAAGVEFTEDPRLVRGLDYYTKTAFEIVSEDLGAQNAVAAGGRYDKLVEQLGGAATPAVGMAIGVERLAMLLSEVKAADAEDINSKIAFISGTNTRVKALSIVRKLRNAGLTIITFPDKTNFKAQFKLANRVHTRWALIFGEDELEKKVILLKDMETGVQTAYQEDDIEKEMKRRLENV